jgi:hypothetical protein
MIGVRQAVAAARDFASDLLDEEKLAGITLEEVELSADDRYWLVTLGFPAATGRYSQFASALARDYKVFKVDAESGSVSSMKIRAAA